MEIVNRDELRIRKDSFRSKILKGDVFIHPTDTVYGIGCNAMDETAVDKVRKIKERFPEKPFSVIAPSIDWIKENCVIDKAGEDWLAKLPGPYTLILELKDAAKIPPVVNSGRRSIGVRFPDHWITEVIAEINTPIITATANKRGRDFMTTLEDLDSDIHTKTDFIIYDGEKPGKPSTLVNLAGEEIETSQPRDIVW